MRKVLVNPKAGELTEALLEFASAAAVSLHPTVRSAFQVASDGLPAIPSLREHEGYLLAKFYLPSSAHDGKAEFFSVISVATSQHILTVVLGLNVESRWTPEADDNSLSGSTSTGSDAILELINRVNSDLRVHLEELRVSVDGIEKKLAEVSRLGQNKALNALADCSRDAYSCEIEIVSVLPLLEEMARIGEDLGSDRIDLRNGAGEEMFNRSLEVSASESSGQSKQLAIACRNLHQRVLTAVGAIRTQQAEVQLRASRFIMALAILFVTPLLLLDVYAQFFAEGQRWSSAFTSNYSWLIMIAISLGQFAFFRRRGWMR